MRLSIIALASFLVCAVFASPIISGRDFDDDLSLSRRGPPKPAAKPAPAAKPSTASKPSTAQQPSKGTGKGSTGGHCMMKRDDAAFQAAVAAGLAGTKLPGRVKIYHVPGGFGGEAAALLKVINGRKSLEDVQTEVKNLAAVHQYLGWAYDDAKKTGYIIMKNMGGGSKETGLAKAALDTLRAAAIADYQTRYKIVSNDAKADADNNFVYHQVGTAWKAEIIDWESAKYVDGGAAPALPAKSNLC